MNNNNFNQHQHHFHQPASSFYNSLLSLEKFIDKKHAFDDFAHLVFKAPLFEDLMAVVYVYTNAFGPMSDREVAMVQKRMYQLNRQTVRAMHEIINQKQLLAGISSKDHSTVPKSPPSSLTAGAFNSLDTTPLKSHFMGHHNHTFSMTPPSSTSHQYMPFGHPVQQNNSELPTTILNTPMQTPTGPDRMHSANANKMSNHSIGNKSEQLERQYNDISVEEFVRIQQNWADNVLTSSKFSCYQQHANDSFQTPNRNSSSMAAMDKNVAAATATFLMQSPQTPIFLGGVAHNQRPFGFGNVASSSGFDDNSRVRHATGRPRRHRPHSETSLLTMELENPAN